MRKVKVFGENNIDDDDKIFEPEDEYFGVRAPVIIDDEPAPKIDGRSKEARAAKGILKSTTKAATPSINSGHGNGQSPPGTITLNQEQLSKLWGVVTGGQLMLDQIGGKPVAHVSLDSFQKALPVLLERL